MDDYKETNMHKKTDIMEMGYIIVNSTLGLSNTDPISITHLHGDTRYKHQS